MSGSKRIGAGDAIGIGLIGTGDIIGRGFVPAVRRAPAARVAAVLSQSHSRAEAFAREIDCPEAYDDLEAFLQSPSVHAVILATRDAAHEAQVIAAAKAGVHVLCSKPMTSTLAGCLRMTAAVAQAGIVFAMAHPLRSHNAFRAVRDVLSTGKLGPLRFVRTLWTQRRDTLKEGWRRDPEQTNYWALGRHGFHLLDLARWYFGEPVDVQAKISNPHHGGPNDELSLVVLTFAEGPVVEIAVSVLFAGGNSLEMYGEAGALTASGIFQYSLEQTPIYVNGERLEYQPNDAFDDQVRNFVEVIRNGGSLISSIEDGIRSVRIAELVLEAARTGKNISLADRPPGMPTT